MHEPRKTMTSPVCQPFKAVGQIADLTAPSPVHAPDEFLEQDYEDRVSGVGEPD